MMKNGIVISRNLCDSCKTKGCIYQYGIVRNHCDFYKAESADKEFTSMSDDVIEAIQTLLVAIGIPLEYIEKTGHWILHPEQRCRECSNCKTWMNIDMPRNSYCPNCGARMVEPKEKRCVDCNHYGKLSLDCGRCDDDCSMYEPQGSEDKE